MRLWAQAAWGLRGPQFLLDEHAAGHLEAFLNQARLFLVGTIFVLAQLRLLPGSTNQLLISTATAGGAWVVIVALLVRYVYHPWIAIAIGLIDTVFVSLLVYLTGGPSSPLEALYSILIFGAAIRFTRAHSLMFTLFVIAAYAEVSWFHPAFNRTLDADPLAVRTVILAATGVLAWLIGAEVA